MKDLILKDLREAQDELERFWVADLRKKYSFTVYEEVLKTVNKHE
jgi:peptidyl-prolyl cis-trans isomerase SurA